MCTLDVCVFLFLFCIVLFLNCFYIMLLWTFMENGLEFVYCSQYITALKKKRFVKQLLVVCHVTYLR